MSHERSHGRVTCDFVFSNTFERVRRILAASDMPKRDHDTGQKLPKE
jgi:hypothetical protein